MERHEDLEVRIQQLHWGQRDQQFSGYLLWFLYAQHVAACGLAGTVEIVIKVMSYNIGIKGTCKRALVMEN